ncbi:alpha/beta hydrolase [Candidatus Gracilibacteria bacterium]|nr:alpha/beta hydrolase [Candidatus Gracilibacteria bacterium]
MKQQIVIIHGGVAKENYSDYLDYVRTIEYDPYAEKLQRWKQTLPIELGENFEYFYPVMPNKHYADYDAWKEMFEKVIPYLRDDVILIGHSLGSSFLFKYLSENTLPVSVATFFSVAGAMTDSDMELLGSFTPDAKKIDQTGIELIYLIHSRDDDVVPFRDFEILDAHLTGNINMIFEDRGHFMGEEFSEIIEEIRKIQK